MAPLSRPRPAGFPGCPHWTTGTVVGTCPTRVPFVGLLLGGPGGMRQLVRRGGVVLGFRVVAVHLDHARVEVDRTEPEALPAAGLTRLGPQLAAGEHLAEHA